MLSKRYYNQLTTEEFIRRAKEKHGDRYGYDKSVYVTAHQKVTVHCQLHGDFNIKAYNHIGPGRIGCFKCGRSLSRSKQLKPKEKFIAECEALYGDRFDFSYVDYKGGSIKVEIHCNVHKGFVFYALPANLLGRKHGCIKCSSKMSRPERDICDILTQHQVKFESQKTFPGLGLNRSLKFDFWLPDYNMCIEYDGLQHYKPVSMSGDQDNIEAKIDNLKLIQIKDNIKTKYCEDNAIKLLRIRYDQDIELSILHYVIHNNTLPPVHIHPTGASYKQISEIVNKSYDAVRSIVNRYVKNKHPIVRRSLQERQMRAHNRFKQKALAQCLYVLGLPRSHIVCIVKCGKTTLQRWILDFDSEMS